jgi:dipeptidyl aminopeptidase/acylaminoacyl peptidase
LLRAVLPDAAPSPALELDDARALAWIPRSTQLAFLSNRSDSAQLHSVDVLTGQTRQLTHAADSVTQYAFAPDGQHLAYATRARGDPASSMFSRLHAEGSGLLVDPNEVSILDLIDPSFASPEPAETQLWLTADVSDIRVDVPGDAARFFWSPDSRKLSVTYVDRLIPRHIVRAQFSSVAIVDAQTGAFTPLLRGQLNSDGLTGTGFSGGEWLDAPERVLVRRITYTDPWVSSHFPDWALIEPGATAPRWTPMESYGARFTTHGANRILVEDTRAGVKALFELGTDGMQRSRIGATLTGSNSLFSFSGVLHRAAFVNQSLSRPPEIYLWSDRPGESRQITTVNAALSSGQLPKFREVRWAGKDGVQVSGWLLEPPAGPESAPWPLVTFVHGGPGYAFANEFAPYFQVWPYPLEILAESGIAVFVPNYRGTQSYGMEIGSPATQDGAPADDIIAGIEHLIDSGIADAKRLGMAGHSHGAWLGPVALTRMKGIRATSFAEGISNLVMAYELMPGKLNRAVHDIKHGASLYDDPVAYLRQSPSLHFDGLSSANLFEGGAQSGAFFSLSFAKASLRQGLPTETIIYPQSGHNLASPKLLRESAVRNLDWFRFWLQGYKDPRPAKAAQYERWDKLRAQQEVAQPRP